MVFEHATLTIAPGREAGFERAFAAVPEIFLSAPGCRSIELRRCVERPGRYLLLVGWDSVEAHMADFRESAGFTRWREVAGPFFAAPPEVCHYQAV